MPSLYVIHHVGGRPRSILLPGWPEPRSPEDLDRLQQRLALPDADPDQIGGSVVLDWKILAADGRDPAPPHSPDADRLIHHDHTIDFVPGGHDGRLRLRFQVGSTAAFLLEHKAHVSTRDGYLVSKDGFELLASIDSPRDHMADLEAPDADLIPAYAALLDRAVARPITTAHGTADDFETVVLAAATSVLEDGETAGVLITIDTKSAEVRAVTGNLASPGPAHGRFTELARAAVALYLPRKTGIILAASEGSVSYSAHHEITRVSAHATMRASAVLGRFLQEATDHNIAVSDPRSDT